MKRLLNTCILCVVLSFPLISLAQSTLWEYATYNHKKSPLPGFEKYANSWITTLETVDGQRLEDVYIAMFGEEYSITYPNGNISVLVAFLNKIGEQGWELTSVSEDDNSSLYVFRRALE